MMPCTVESLKMETLRSTPHTASLNSELVGVGVSNVLWLQVGVHIADVGHFIRPGNALDREAANRGTTVYLCGRVSLTRRSERWRLTDSSRILCVLAVGLTFDFRIRMI